MADLSTSRTSGYPTALDTQSIEEKDEGVAGATAARSQPVQALVDGIIKVETELGVNPSGSYATVVARLDAIGAGNDATITSADHYGGASSSDGIALATYLQYRDLTLEINGTAVRVNASAAFPQRVAVAGKLRAVADATTATTTLSGSAGARYIMADVSATATTFLLTNDTDNMPTATQKLVGVAYWDGAATKVLKTLDGKPFLYAYQASGQSLPDSTTTVLSIDTEVYDSHAAYNTGTYTWTCPEDGYYTATGVLTTTSAPGSNNNHVWTKNGTTAGFFYSASSSINARSLSVFADQYQKGDTLTFASRPNGALTSSAGVTSTYLVISKVGA